MISSDSKANKFPAPLLMAGPHVKTEMNSDRILWFKKPITVFLMVTAGAGILAVLLQTQDIGDVLASLRTAGFNIVWVAAYRMFPLAVDALGWRILIAKRRRPGIFVFVYARWIGESCNWLLPAAQVGGHMIRALLIAGHGMTKALASASVLVDVTVGLVTQLVFILLGMLPMMRKGIKGIDPLYLVGGASLVLLVLSGFILVQRAGVLGIFSNGMRKIFKKVGPANRFEGVRRFEAETGMMYADRRRIFECAVIRLFGWFSKSGEVYLALFFLGAPVSVADAILIEAVSTAANSFGFIFPGALGIREGGILAVGAALGIPSEAVLAMALIKRTRELLIGVPGLATFFILKFRSQIT